MDRLAGRRVVLGVGGGIAAYKAAELCRRLSEAGAHVHPVLTASAVRFVGEVTFSALAGRRALTSLWEGDDPVPHVTLGQGADVVVVAPATADLLGAYAAGLAPDLLGAVLLATRAPVVLCPAMHTEMWEHAAVVDNVRQLRARGVRIVGPARGRLTGPDEGLGRMAEPPEIVAVVAAGLAPSDLVGRRVVVTAGGTREPVDAVRFLANRSSGRQGNALAAEAAARGADVTLVTTVAGTAPPGVAVVPVTTAAEMEAAVLGAAGGADVVVMAAAVADFRPKAPVEGKLDKGDGPPELVLEPTTDILAALGRDRRPGQVLVGFAAEVGDPRDRGARKLAAKGADLMVANDVAAPGSGFGEAASRAILLEAGGGERDLGLVAKEELAAAVFDYVARRLAGSP